MEEVTVGKTTFREKMVGPEKVWVAMGGILPVIAAAIEFAKQKGENIKLCFNDTTVVVAPGSNQEEVWQNWTRLRYAQEKK